MDYALLERRKRLLEEKEAIRKRLGMKDQRKHMEHETMGKLSTSNNGVNKQKRHTFWVCKKKRGNNLDEGARNVEDSKGAPLNADGPDSLKAEKDVDATTNDLENKHCVEQQDNVNDTTGDSSDVNSKAGSGEAEREENDALFDIDTFNINNKTPYEDLFYKPLHVLLAPLFKCKLETSIATI